MGQNFEDYPGFQQIHGMPILLQHSVHNHFLFSSTVDCQLGPWTSCDSDCGFAGKTRFFGKWSNRKGVKCFQGDTWQKCGNLPPCAGDFKYISLLTYLD